MRYLVMTIKNNVPDEIAFLTDDRKEAEEVFIEECKANVPNFEQQTKEDIDDILADGFVEYDKVKSVCLLDLINTEGYQDGNYQTSNS